MSVMRCVLSGWLALQSLSWNTAAHAQVVPVCTASATPIVLSSAIDPVLGGDGASTGAITLQCSGVLTLLGLAACVKISPAPGSARTLSNVKGALSYEIFQNSGFTVPWGDVNTTGRGANFGSLIGVSGTQTLTAYLRVNNSATAIPGAYSGTANVIVSYSQVTALLGCNSIGLGSTTATSFSISADVRSRCTVSATPLSFGPTGLLNAERLQAANIVARCSNTTPYSIALDEGLNSAGSGLRRMKNANDAIRYDLFRDSQRTLPWGGANTASGIGSGLDQNYSVYGRVPPQTTPAAGTYTDRVVVTVTY